jgi:hypothetical protein
VVFITLCLRDFEAIIFSVAFETASSKSFISFGFNLNLPDHFGTYPPAGYKFFPEGLTGTVGVGFRFRPCYPVPITIGIIEGKRALSKSNGLQR